MLVNDRDSQETGTSSCLSNKGKITKGTDFGIGKQTSLVRKPEITSSLVPSLGLEGQIEVI
jgi:hypothetical protein